jgi:hypothetical protein
MTMLNRLAPPKVATSTFAITIMFMLVGCDTKDWEAAGYQDGYAATINTTCKFRTSLVHGKWDNVAYSKGYSLGANAGSAAVAAQGCDRFR